MPDTLRKEMDKEVVKIFTTRNQFMQNAIRYYINHCKMMARKEEKKVAL